VSRGRALYPAADEASPLQRLVRLGPVKPERSPRFWGMRLGNSSASGRIAPVEPGRVSGRMRLQAAKRQGYRGSLIGIIERRTLLGGMPLVSREQKGYCKRHDAVPSVSEILRRRREPNPRACQPNE
jgi:hypothetical protein